MIYLQEEGIEAVAFQSMKEGKTYCGDSYFIEATDRYFICVLADGLGSGEHAFRSSSAVVSIVQNNHEKDVNTLMKECNEVLSQQRGAAVSILKVDFYNQIFTYSSVGNIRFFLYSPEGILTYPIPVKGYLSGRPQSYNTQQFKYVSNSKFILHTDGLNIKSAKSILQTNNIKKTAEIIKQNNITTNDDTTVIIGHLH